MAFLQFPWRLLAILAPIFALSLAKAFNKIPGAPFMTASSSWVGCNALASPIAVTVLAAALAFPAYHVFRQPCDPEDTAPARFALFQSNAGTDPTDEYTPATADNDALQPTDPPYWLADSDDAAAPLAGRGINAGAPDLASETWDGAPTMLGPTPMHFAVPAPHPQYLILNLRDYPAWSITLNGASIRARDPRPDGLIAFPIPDGLSIIDIHYARMTDQTIGNAITLLTLPVFLFTLRSKQPARR
jgi:hypothetical protein